MDDTLSATLLFDQSFQHAVWLVFWVAWNQYVNSFSDFTDVFPDEVIEYCPAPNFYITCQASKFQFFPVNFHQWFEFVRNFIKLRELYGLVWMM